jgi:hypothetical protein
MTRWWLALALAMVACNGNDGESRRAKEAARVNATIEKLHANRRTFDELRRSLGSLVAALPDRDASKKVVACGEPFASGTKVTTIEDEVLQAIVLDPLPAMAREAQLARMSELSRWNALSSPVWRELLADALVDGEARAKPDQTVWNGKEHTLWNVPKLASWFSTEILIVFRGTKVEPVMKGSSFEPGSFEGTMYVIDVARKTSCHAPLSVKSGMFAKTGGDSGGLTAALVRDILRVARAQLKTIAPGLELPATKGE